MARQGIRVRLTAGALSAAVCLALLAAGCARPAPADPGRQDDAPGRAAAGAEPRPDPLRNAYFGDLHVHSSWSLDAWTFGHPMRNDPSVAYRYGRGEPILDAEGNVRGQLAAPLDFMAVTDHDNWLGEVQLCQDADTPAADLPVCRAFRAGSVPAFFRLRAASLQSRRDADLCERAEPGPDNRCDQRAAHQWPRVQAMADAFYEPGRVHRVHRFRVQRRTPRQRGLAAPQRVLPRRGDSRLGRGGPYPRTFAGASVGLDGRGVHR